MMNEITFNDLPTEMGKLKEKVEKIYDFLTGKNQESGKQESVNYEEPMLLEQASIFLKVSKPTLYRYCSKRIVPYYKNEATQRLYFLQKDLIEFLKNGKKKTSREIQNEVFNNQQKKL